MHADLRGRPLVPLRPLAVTEILDAAVRVVWTNRRSVFAVSAPFAVLIAGGDTLASYLSLTDGSSGIDLPAQLLTLAVQLVFGAVVTALVAHTVVGAVTAGEVPPVRSLLRRVLPLIALALIVGVGELVGLVALIVGGVLLWGFWAVAAPALVLEGLGPIAALQRSARLVRGGFGRVFGTRALGWLITTVVGALVLVPAEVAALLLTGADSLSGDGTDQPLLATAVLAIGQVVSSLLVTPLRAAVDVLIYTDLRMRREGMDIVMTLPPDTAPARPVSAW